MRTIKTLTLLMSMVLLSSANIRAADSTGMDPELHDKAKRAVDAGLHYLRLNQNDNGSWRRLHLPTRSWVHALPVYAMGTVATYWFIKRVLMMVPAT